MMSLASEAVHFDSLTFDQRARRYVGDDDHNGVMAREELRTSLPMQILINCTLMAVVIVISVSIDEMVVAGLPLSVPFSD